MKKNILLFILIFNLTFILSSQVTYSILESSPPRQIPWHNRKDSSVSQYLRPAVRAPRGSGTICWYDKSINTAYVITCAHTMNGDKSGTYYISTFFNGDKREIRKYKAKLLLWNNTEDLALMSFQPDKDLVIDWVPIGSKKSPFYHPRTAPSNEEVVVTGRDKGIDPPRAHQAFIRPSRGSAWYLESYQAQSYGGRSGGGAMTKDRDHIIGVNHGRGTTVNNIGHGLWSPLYRIHKFLSDNNYGFLLNVGSPLWANNVEVFNINGFPTKKEYKVYLPNR